jgi:hypothetical protein
MKLNLLTTILAIAMASIITFFLSSYFTDKNNWLFSIGCFVSLGLTLLGTISLSFDYERTTMLTRTASGVFLLLLLGCQIIFASMHSFLVPTYVLVVGIMTVLHTLVVYGITKFEH